MARVDLRENQYLEKFVSQDHISSNDNHFWHQLLSCSFNFMRVHDPKVVEKTLDPYLVLLAINNGSSHNFGSLIRVCLDRIAKIRTSNESGTDPYYVYQSFNAIYLIRSISKSYIENSTEEKLVQSFRAIVDPPITTQNAKMRPKPYLPPVQAQNQLQPQPQAQPPPSSSPPPPPPSTQVDSQPQHLQVESNDQASKTDLKVASPSQDQNTATPRIEEQEHTISQDGEGSKKPETTPGIVMLEQYLSTLIAIIVDLPQTDATYLLQVEAINALLVLLSVQMYTSTPADQSIIYKSLMQRKASIHSLVLTKTLLSNFIQQRPVPQEAGSIIIGLASGLWRVLTLGYGANTDEESNEMPLLARQSLLLLNILTNHYTNEKNPYREAMISCQDSRFNLTDPQVALDNANNDAMATASTSKSILTSNSIKIEFNRLYSTICMHLNNDQVALLLYLLLHRNKIFKPYILTTAASNLDSLVIPLLKILYSSIERGSHHVYMVLIIFIILSEQAQFNQAIHKIIVKDVPWYKDRLINEITLGSLTTLILIRSFQYNTIRVKDKFLHSNLFATIANLSDHFQNLHPYVCQRLVELLERLSKRYIASTKPVEKGETTKYSQSLGMLDQNNPLARALATNQQQQDIQDVSAIELDSTNNPGAIVQQNGDNINEQISISIPETQQIQSASAIQSNNVDIVAAATSVDTFGREHSQSTSSQQSPNSNSTADHINISMDDAKQDISFIEEVVRMLLEVISNSLTTQLKSNPDLVYTLLYKRSVFTNLISSHPSFYNMVIDVERILTFFYNRIESFQRQMSAEEIIGLIKEASHEWVSLNQNNADSNSRLLFHYVEDDQPEEFFIPYIWTRIYYSSGIVWNAKRIVLFNPDEI